MIGIGISNYQIAIQFFVEYNNILQPNETTMSTYTRIIYQIVFSTKYRERTLIKSGREELFKYITGLLQDKNCHLYQINGVEDHIHILTDLHPTIALSNLVKDIKLATTHMIKKSNIFPDFAGWQTGFGAFTYSMREKEILIAYIMNQEVHHHETTSMHEFKTMLVEAEVDYDERFLV